MNSRERILQRLYASQASAQNPEQTSQTTGIQAEHAAGWTQLAQSEWLASFKQNLLDNHAEVIETTTANWAGELAQQLTARGVKRLLSGEHKQGRVLLNALAQFAEHQAAEQPSAAIDVQLVTTALSKEELFTAVDAGFSVASAGLAETGSLLVETGPQEPRALSLVPPLNIILLNASAITASFLTLVQAQKLPAHMPTNVLLISGPSKTADIQQTLAYGAHGPKELIVLLLTDA
ncbi:LutC/YkgG family protein [Thalassolituus alkanivorans]|uniref:LutC/YkgG family protein n=1 Tax=Thalassolituus alkanivorans TaxID=2881055 RepID=UPI001E61BC45|nr:LUD domain-containing protein [Thalassolituus alkanivorans]MCB2385893.1 LUD domain-containing protein [Thalassolituus alkanivorans]MCB2421743.1 LUD domain-containing protein [Thalassolituus alkanivorans]